MKYDKYVQNSNKQFILKQKASYNECSDFKIPMKIIYIKTKATCKRDTTNIKKRAEIISLEYI